MRLFPFYIKEFKMEKDRLVDLSDIEKKQKKEAISSLPNSPRATTELPSSGPRIDEITSPTVSTI